MSSHLASRITQIIKNIPGGIDIHGLDPGATPYLLPNIAASQQNTSLVLLPHADMAEQQAALSILFAAHQKYTQLNDQILFLPGWARSPYLEIAPSVSARHQRLRVLFDLGKHMNSSRIIFTSFEGLALRLPEPIEFFSRRIDLCTGQRLTREQLETQLFNLGYQKLDPVDTPGSYSARGFMVDVFPINSPHPLRIEFFDDELEKIRPFNPTTQVTLGHTLVDVQICPASLIDQSTESLLKAAKNIKEYCDNYDIPKQARKELNLRLERQSLEPLDEYLWPLFNTSKAWSLKNLIQAPSTLSVLYDPELTIKSSLEFFDELNNDFKSTQSSKRLTCSPIDLYPGQLTEDDIGRFSVRIHKYFLGTNNTNSVLSLEPAPQTPTHTVAVDSLSKFESINKFYETLGYSRVIFVPSRTQQERVLGLLQQRNIKAVASEHITENPNTILVIQNKLAESFCCPDDKLVVFSDVEILGGRRAERNATTSTDTTNKSTAIKSLRGLRIGDLLVHISHGIGIYRGLHKIKIDGQFSEFLLIEYRDADKLYLPIYRLDLIQKYLGSGDNPTLDKLGAAQFEKAKKKAKDSLKLLAGELIRLYAERKEKKRSPYKPIDENYREFEAAFPYAETPDQETAINSINRDLESERIMDRLLCGDVGFGKTEVAMRAAFRAVEDGFQVAVLVPTTILCFQHERSFRERMKQHPINVGSVSRFKSAKDNKELLLAVGEGKVDILIGTHRLLSKDVVFKNLGLVIIDEEHRFGVEHKERLKLLRTSVNCLALSATPIPRTLQMSLFGLRDVSLINTPPAERLSIKTFIAPFSIDVIRSAILQEIGRGGQVFFVHNRVQTIMRIYDRLTAALPGIRILVAHAQMSERELEQKMTEFYEKKHDVLLSTTIIESGIDIPTANTIIINRATHFGLAQLYQLRGRVGRSNQKAYCYLLLPEDSTGVTDNARERLDIMQRFADLGAGFQVASQDLEMRGGGDLLGSAQAGHVASVGYELFLDLLDEAVREEKGEHIKADVDPEISIFESAYLPENYIPDTTQRLDLYKRFSQCVNQEALQALEQELEDRFGALPQEALALTWLIRIKQLLVGVKAVSLKAGKDSYSIEFAPNANISSEKILSLITTQGKIYRLTPPAKLVIEARSGTAHQLYEHIEGLLSKVAVRTP